MSGDARVGWVFRGFRAAIAVVAVVLVVGAAVALAQPPGQVTEYAVYIQVVGPDSAGNVVPIAGASVRAYPFSPNAVTTNANGQAVVPVADTVQAGDLVHVIVRATGYQSNELRYQIDQSSAVRVVRNPHSSILALLHYVVAQKDSYTTIAMEPGSDPPEPAGDTLQMTIQVKDSQLSAVPGAVVVFCCSPDGRAWRANVADQAGEVTDFFPRPWFESGLVLQVTAPDGRSRYSEVPTSVLDESGARLFLITLPDKQVTHPWAGDWKDSFGAFGLRWLPWDQFITLPDQPGHAELWDKLRTLCAFSGAYYEGGYNDPGDQGKIVACASSSGMALTARYLSDTDGHGGFFHITLNSPTSWSGVYRDDGKAPGPWSGTFEKHFQGDGATG
jgi:hypothetical protein